MMKHEFERLAGYEVSAEDYNNIIEPMYMATDLSKEDFVAVMLPMAVTSPQSMNKRKENDYEYQNLSSKLRLGHRRKSI